MPSSNNIQGDMMSTFKNKFGDIAIDKIRNVGLEKYLALSDWMGIAADDLEQKTSEAKKLGSILGHVDAHLMFIEKAIAANDPQSELKIRGSDLRIIVKEGINHE